MTVRWGVEVAVGSPVITVSVLVPSNDGYVSLTGIPLQSPVQISLWLSEKDDIKIRTNPQCVHWSTARGYGLKFSILIFNLILLSHLAFFFIYISEWVNGVVWVALRRVKTILCLLERL